MLEGSVDNDFNILWKFLDKLIAWEGNFLGIPGQRSLQVTASAKDYTLIKEKNNCHGNV